MLLFMTNKLHFKHRLLLKIFALPLLGRSFNIKLEFSAILLELLIFTSAIYRLSSSLNLRLQNIRTEFTALVLGLPHWFQILSQNFESEQAF